MTPDLLARLRGGLIVSCQALPGEPLHGAAIMAAMARAAHMGGACGIRANGPDDIRAIKAACALPVIGLHKVDYPNSPVYITPTLAEARAVAAAGADVLAVDATARPRPDGLSLPAFLARIRAELGLPVLADVATVAGGLAAAAAGAALVSTTMSGYTDDSPQQAGPDYALVAELARCCPVPVVAEGRYWTAAEARQALALGAHAVVVGTAITRPQEIVRRFVRELSGAEAAP